MAWNTETQMILGALLADAAALGLHWLYDQDRISQIASRHGSPAFVPIDEANYEDVMGFFAHADRHCGCGSQYGETLELALRTANAKGGLTRETYAAAFAKHFDAGGMYCGYIDKPTRAALDALRAGKIPSGSDDDQIPALSTLPVLVALNANADLIAQVVSITHTAPVAQDAVGVGADLLYRLKAGAPLADALSDAAQNAPDSLRSALQAALTAEETQSVVYANVTGPACKLTMTMPLIFHILKHSRNYVEAVETNILASGDSCGRSILLGAAAALAHGAETLPWSWGVAHMNLEMALDEIELFSKS